MQVTDGIGHEVRDGVGRIVLKRPEHANSLTSVSARALVRAIDAVLTAQPRAILLAAEGRVFCAGGDIDEFVAAGRELPALIEDILGVLHPALLRLSDSPVPLVAAVNGPVAGAGIGLALCADFVLGATSMKLRTGYAAIGLSPDAGASYFLARRAGPLRAMQWLMTSETIAAERCLAAGVIDALYSDAELPAAAEGLVARLATSATASLGGIKQLCAGLPGRSLAEHLDLECAVLVARASGADAREGVAAFVEKRAPRFSGR